LLTGWTALFVALWVAAVFAFVGAIIGFVAGGAATFNLGQGSEAFTIAGSLGGAAAGFLLGFGVIFGGSIAAAPLHVLISLGVGVVAAVFLTWLSDELEDLSLDLRSYRRPSHRAEEQRVVTTLIAVSEALGYRAPPTLRIADQPLPGAWTYTRTIVVTKGLIKQLDGEEITAILAHELHHCASGDALAQRFVWGCCFPIVLLHNLYTVVMKSLWWKALVVLFLWPAPVLMRWVVAPIMTARGRTQEFEADAAAIAAGYGPALARALNKLQNFEVARTGWEAAILRTHPPTEFRLEAIEAAATPSSVPQPNARTRGPVAIANQGLGVRVTSGLAASGAGKATTRRNR
jgi:Zn-dependent protease with chaperone function